MAIPETKMVTWMIGHLERAARTKRIPFSADRVDAIEFNGEFVPGALMTIGVSKQVFMVTVREVGPSEERTRG